MHVVEGTPPFAQILELHIIRIISKDMKIPIPILCNSYIIAVRL